MSDQPTQSNLYPPNQSSPRAESNGLGILKSNWTNVDNRDVSAQMLATSAAAAARSAQANVKPFPATCRHFRHYVPREFADELRDADPEPCPVCDAMPHRKAKVEQW